MKTVSTEYKKLVDFCNNFYLGQTRKLCIPFYINNKHVGILRQDVVEQIQKHPKDFLSSYNDNNTLIRITLSDHLKTFEERSDRLAEILEGWRAKGIFITLNGWRNECYNVFASFFEEPLMKIERAATSLLGTVQYGVHINGYVNHPERGTCMWVARRSATKQTFPNKLDQMVAGGLASGQSIMECARKECEEEASITDPAILDKLKPAGCVSYCYEDERGLFPECNYVFDLELSAEFIPKANDKEVHSFTLVPIEELKELITKKRFAFNCALVNLDFLIRRGFIHPDNEPHYQYLVESMHRKLLSQESV